MSDPKHEFDESIDRLIGAAWSGDHAAQRQDSLTDQLRDLYRIAVKEGMYDAAECVRLLFDWPGDDPLKPGNLVVVEIPESHPSPQ